MSDQAFEWEIIGKRNKQFDVFAGHQSEPCVSIHKGGFTFSKQFVRTFGFKPGGAALVLFDPKAGKIGFKVAVNSSEVDAAYGITCCTGKKKAWDPNNVTSVRIGCPAFVASKIDPIFVNRIYRASMVNGSAIIAIDLDSPLDPAK